MMNQMEEVPTKTNQSDISTDRDVDEEIVLHPVEAAELEAVLAAVQGVATGLERLQASFDSKLKYDASKERMIETLHKELQGYREGLHFKILRPLLMELIALYDDMDNVLRYAPDSESEEAMVKELRRHLQGFQESIEEILVRHDVEIYSEADERFNAQRQRAIRTVATPDKEKDRLVAVRIRKGFAYGERVLRPEIVATYKLVNPEEQS